MKFIFKILVFLLLLVICTAEDCGDSYSESRLNELNELNMFSELEDDLTVEELDNEKLQVMDQRAIQKFRELFDYLALYSDTGLNIEFRQQARKVLVEYFISEQALQQFFSQLELKEDTMKQVLITKAGTNLNVEIDSIIISDNLKRTSTLTYIGEIEFVIKLQETIYNKRLNIIAHKEPKQFGENSVNVWAISFDFKI